MQQTKAQRQAAALSAKVARKEANRLAHLATMQARKDDKAAQDLADAQQAWWIFDASRKLDKADIALFSAAQDLGIDLSA